MKFLLMTLISHVPDSVTQQRVGAAARLRDVVETAVLAEELGFDGFAVGERHEDPFISTIGLFTAVTTLSLLDPVRAFEDYSTLDNLSGGRLELIGKGNGTAQADLFGVTTADQWDRNRERYELFRQLWRSDRSRGRGASVRLSSTPRHSPGRCKPRFASGTAAPRAQSPSTSPLASVTRSSPPTSPIPSSPTPNWFGSTDGVGSSMSTDPRTRWSALVGSPEQVIDKVGRYHDQLGHEVMHVSADTDGVSAGQKRRRDGIPSRPLVSQTIPKAVLAQPFSNDS